ncbi:CYFA0S05e01552g1_1 [Cyberlindnera fabianii]|uniref:CYFA0S05e01552g1_1 n=1 Tax=Cyberlindnera fabianii TaxID=36022 RepID=A0A061ASE1_CYBFA|nr:CYFA0S05e01552g1_1 [Cyberlindnera fabianii]
MSRLKTATPPASGHPANKLTYVDEEMKNALLRTPFALLLEHETYKIQLQELRNDWRYAWVIQWLYYFRGAIKLSGEPFTVDLLEEELVGLTEPSLINKIPTNLAAALLGTKVTIDDFSFRARFLLGNATEVLGTEESPVEYQSLSLLDKFEVLHCLIVQLQYTDLFRAQVEKYENPSELRFEPIFEDSKVSFYLLSDNRIYKRSITNFPKIEVPRKYKRAKHIVPLEKFANIEPEVQWEVVAIGIYQIHDFLVSLKGNKKFKSLFDNIKEHINDLAQEDLNTRKKILKRKRDQQLNDLVSNRKRSSRLVQKEEQLRLESERKKEQEELLKKEQEKARIQRRYKQKLNQLKKDLEERLRRQTQSRRSAILEEYKPSNADDIELGEGDWLFDCYCGIREKNYDDGVKLIVCERCQRWQHLKCQDRAVRQELATKADEVLICKWCLEELEKEVVEKLEAERIAEEEAEAERERQRELQRELHRKKMEEERKRLEEQERLLEIAEKQRRDELEKERQRRALERQSLVSSAASTPPSTTATAMGTPSQVQSHVQPPVHPEAQPQTQPQPQSQNSHPSISPAPPLVGTFEQQQSVRANGSPMSAIWSPNQNPYQQPPTGQWVHSPQFQAGHLSPQSQFQGQLPPQHQMAPMHVQLPPQQQQNVPPQVGHQQPAQQPLPPPQQGQQQQQQQEQQNGSPNGGVFSVQSLIQ